MSVLSQVSTRVATVSEVFCFLWQRKLWWLIPLAMLIFVLGLLFVIAQLSSVAPWMYPV
jgi:Na+-translocating ferredoxin:NAD+ oxidoreductase RnfD subunit